MIRLGSSPSLAVRAVGAMLLLGWLLAAGTSGAAAQSAEGGVVVPGADPYAPPQAEVPPPPPAEVPQPPPTETTVPPPPDDSVPPPPPGYGTATSGPVTAAAPPVPVGPPVEVEEPTEPHVHSGFYLRFGLGFDWLSASLDGTFAPFDAAGGAVGFYVAIGGNVSENLAFFGDLFFAGAGNAGLESGGTTTGEGRLTLMGTGPGIAWYFMPINIHVTLSAALVNVQATDADGLTLADAGGWGLHAQVGKEWWIGDEWGLGVMGQLILATLQEQQSLFALGLLASVTFN